MRAEVAARFVDVMLEDSLLVRPNDVVSALRSPAGRKPAESSQAVADALASLDDTQAALIVRAALDAAYFSVFNLLDADMKNSGIRVEIVADSGRWKSDEFPVPLHEIYRDRVEPNGSVRKPS